MVERRAMMSKQSGDADGPRQQMIDNNIMPDHMLFLIHFML